LCITYVHSLALVNPGNNFAAFQTAATGNNATATTTPPAASTSTTAASATPSGTTQQVHQVVVGGPGKLYYTPSNITAQVGDIVQFQFQQKNHTVTQVRKTFMKHHICSSADQHL
jgi:plastocyanin